MPDRLLRRAWEMQAQGRRQRLRRPLQLARMMTPLLLLIALAAATYASSNATGMGLGRRAESTRTVSTTSGAIQVIDGDTVRFNGERLRLLVIDAPEIHSPRCAAEHQAGIESKRALADFLAYRLVEVQYSGRRDVFGRPLVKLAVNGSDAGSHLLSRNLAIRYAWGKAISKIYWCGLW
jgi:micrococcal nuclease